MFNTYQRARFLLVTACVISFALAWWIASIAGVPAIPGHDIRILNPIGMPVTFGVAILAALIGTVIAGSVRFDAGLVAAAAAMMALSARGGDGHDQLFSATSPAIYLTMIGETAALYGVLLLVWAGLWSLHRIGLLRRDATRDSMPEPTDPLTKRLIALLVNALLMAVLVYFLAQSDSKKQAMVAVALAGFLATAATHQIIPVSPSVWFWMAPMLVAITGYAMSYSDPGNWFIGMIPQPLARAIPLDYASAGTIGTVVGYWMSRRWQRDREETEAEPATA